eukprot:m51a1_g438 putative C-tail anchored protein (490) ;mRNA; f:68912-71111
MWKRSLKKGPYGKLAEGVFGAPYVQLKNGHRVGLEEWERCNSLRDSTCDLSEVYLSPSAISEPPAPDEGRCRFLGNAAASLVTSTYPRSRKTGERFGDPISDCVGVMLYPHVSVACIADGCGWGMIAREAAGTASSAFIEQMQRPARDGVHDTRDLSRALLDAIANAHLRILGDGKETWNKGTSALLGVAIARHKEAKNIKTKYAVVCASVGGCRAFVVHTCSGSAILAKELTATTTPCIACLAPASSSSASSSSTSAAPGGGVRVAGVGGRIGPSELNGTPDLRNLGAFITEAEEGDLVVLITDGIGDNLDPEILGITPTAAAEYAGFHGPSVPPEGAAWSALDVAAREALKRAYTEYKMSRLLAVSGCDVKVVCERLVEHCEMTVTATRDYMEEHPGTRQPEDRTKYPGKMSHTSCVCLRVGGLSHSMPASKEDDGALVTNLSGVLSPIADRVAKKLEPTLSFMPRTLVIGAVSLVAALLVVIVLLY